MTNNYESIHCHSNFSIRDSIAKIDEMAKRNKELGMKCLCITDHGSVLATTEAFMEAEKHGLKPIIGCELYTIDEEERVFPVQKKGERRNHFIIIPKTWEAMTRLFKIMTHAAKNKFSGFPRVSYQYLLGVNLDDMWISGACSVGMLSSYRYEEIVTAFYEKCGDNFYLEIIPVSYIDTKITNKYNEIKEKIEKMGASDDERMYFDGIKEELINSDGIDGGKIANTRAVEMHKKYGIRLTATNDSHYVHKEDSVTHEVLLAVNSGKKMSDEKRWKLGDGEIYIKSFDEMTESFEKLGYIDSDIVRSALLETNNICEEVNVVIPKFYANLPSPTPEINDSEALQFLVDRGINWYKINDKKNKDVYYDRIKEEIGVLNEFGLERYFLIMADIYDFMRENEIPHGPGRGSVTGSLVAFLTGITYVDSIEHKCIFSRFINEGRMNKTYDKDGNIQITTDDLCDIDSDVSKSRRMDVIQYIRDKYGKKYVSQISNYNSFTPKSSFKAVTSVFGIPFKESNRLSSLIEESTYNDKDGKVIPYGEIDSFIHKPELVLFFEENPGLLQHILKINGTASALGRHAGAVIISNTPISDVCSVDIRNDVEVASLNMHDISKRGCLKLDMLGLATSDQLFNACKTAGLDPYGITLDDEATNELLASAKTSAIFQMESFLAKKTLKDIGKIDLKTLTAINAIIRPGALQSKDKDGVSTYDKYVKRANGSIETEYIIPELKNITEDTYGTIIFQEQVTKIFNELANFSLQESDIIRRAVAKKKVDIIDKHRLHFISGCKENNISEADSNEIFNLIINSSSYLFGYNHSLAYSMSSYRTAYLKTHYPVDFWTSTLTYAAKKELLPEYIKDAKRQNVDILYPDINKSSASEFTIHDKKILAPLNAIKGVGNVAADFIIQARPKDGFKSYDDFLNVLTEKKLNGKINKRVKDILYRANAFKSLDYFVQDKQERRNNLRELLSLFSPLPSINFKTGRGVDKVAYQELITTAKKCCQRARNGNFVNPVGGARPSIFVVMDISKSNTTLFETPYTNWFPEHLRIRLDVPKGALYFSNALKCSHYNVEKKDIPGACWTLCTKEFLKREIEIIRPRLVINTVSKICPWISGVKGLRFAESFGKIYFSATTDSYVMNIPSAQWIKYSEDIREVYKTEIIPLLENLNKDQKQTRSL